MSTPRRRWRTMSPSVWIGSRLVSPRAPDPPLPRESRRRSRSLGSVCGQHSAPAREPGRLLSPDSTRTNSVTRQAATPSFRASSTKHTARSVRLVLSGPSASTTRYADSGDRVAQVIPRAGRPDRTLPPDRDQTRPGAAGRHRLLTEGGPAPKPLSSGRVPWHDSRCATPRGRLAARPTVGALLRQWSTDLTPLGAYTILSWLWKYQIIEPKASEPG